MNSITKKVNDELIKLGASMVGFGDITELPDKCRNSLPVGISVAVKFPPAVILGISEHPTKEYKDWRTKLNGSLNIIVKSGAEILAGMGFNAIYLETGDEKIPHKTIATRAGVGWIGKCALLVTEEYGSAIRIASILTDAPLTISIPINSSKCKDSCNSCMSSCPKCSIGKSMGRWNSTGIFL